MREARDFLLLFKREGLVGGRWVPVRATVGRAVEGGREWQKIAKEGALARSKGGAMSGSKIGR